MPTRNSLIIVISLVACYASYGRATKLRYASTISEAIATVTSNYVEPVEEREMFQNAMTGLVNGLDENSQYFPPVKYDQLRQELDQEFVGVGVEISTDPETHHVLVVSPLFDSPAYHAGIRAGDLIVSVDYEDTATLSIQESIQRMKGLPGTSVRLQVLPYGKEDPRTVNLVRQHISVVSLRGDSRNPNGTWNFVLDSHPRMGYIRIDNFGENTAQEFRDVMMSLDGKIEGLIIDLRDNPGGLLTAARDLCNAFMDEGVIVTIRGRGGVIDERIVAGESETFVPATLPVVVLVNGMSASASEILAACLQDHDRASIVGQRTWGKGTVQRVFPFEGGRGAMKFTTHTYWRPSGKNIHRSTRSREDEDESGDWGVRPDPGNEVMVPMDEHRKVLLWRRERDAVLRRQPELDVADKDNQVELPDSNETPGDAGTRAASGEPPAGEQVEERRGAEGEGVVQANGAEQVERVEDRQLNRAIEVLREKIEQSSVGSATSAAA